MFSRCPKCGHRPLPLDQSLPAACPACDVILAKVAAGASRRPHRMARTASMADVRRRRRVLEVLFRTPVQSDRAQFVFRFVLLAGFTVWGLRLIALDYRTGEMNQSFLHGPLLVFHEAGHVIFRLFGEWVGVLGGTLGQLVMPAIMALALLWKNRDPFGAALGLWLLGVSLLDVAPYMYDALVPQLMLLSGATGEAGGHDWIYLFDSLGWRGRSQAIGAFTHALGALTVLLALAWASVLLLLQRRRRTGAAARQRNGSG